MPQRFAVLSSYIGITKHRDVANHFFIIIVIFLYLFFGANKHRAYSKKPAFVRERNFPHRWSTQTTCATCSWAIRLKAQIPFGSAEFRFDSIHDCSHSGLRPLMKCGLHCQCTRNYFFGISSKCTVMLVRKLKVHSTQDQP